MWGKLNFKPYFSCKHYLRDFYHCERYPQEDIDPTLVNHQNNKMIKSAKINC